jgi:hypothetical protein
MGIARFQKWNFAWPYEEKKSYLEFLKFGGKEEAIRFICKVIR